MSKKHFAFLAICLFIIAIFTTACGGGKATPPSYPFIPVPTPTPSPTPAKYPLELSQTEFTLNVGETDNITVTLNGEDITETATYTVDQEAIASVEQGLITGLSAGFATVTVHAENAEEDKTFTVNVIDPSLPTLEVTPSEVNLGLIDETTVIVTFEGKDVTKEVTYKSNEESIATAEKGVVKSKYTEGTAKIAVSLTGANSGFLTVNVTDDSEKVELNNDVLRQLGYEKVKNSEDNQGSNYYHYDIYKDGDIVTNIEIPAIYNYEGKKYKITSIGYYAFYKCTALTNITIPESVTIIREHAFEECKACETINIPDNVTYIGSNAFNDCKELTSINIPYGVTTIGEHTFYNCSSLTSITLPNSVTTIGQYVFYNCNSLESITLSNSVTTIGQYAFKNCSKLTGITIPNSVTAIGSHLFDACELLENVTLSSNLTYIPGYTFRNCNNLNTVTISDETVLCVFPMAFIDCQLTKLTTTSGGTISFPTTKDYSTEGNVTFIYAKKASEEIIENTIEIPNKVTRIPEYAFKNAASLTKIIIPKSVTIIENAAFYGCKSLGANSIPKTITIPDSVTSIGSITFYGCKSLESITIPNSVTSIGKEIFKNCDELKTVKIGNGVTKIPEYAFEGCVILESVTIPKNTIKTIGTKAFLNCKKLESINLGNALTTIGNGAFQDCKLLNSVIIPDTVLCIFPSAFYDSTSNDQSALSHLTTQTGRTIEFPTQDYSTVENVTFIYARKELGEEEIAIDIPNGVTEIPLEAFKKKNLTGITIPISVTSIGDNAFDSCPLTTIALPESLTTIEKMAFFNCKISDITIPNSVTSIGDQTFDYSNDNIINIIFDSEKMKAAGATWGAKKVNGVTL